MTYSAPIIIAGIVDHRARTARLQWLALTVVAVAACTAATALGLVLMNTGQQPSLYSTVADLRVAAVQSSIPRPLANITVIPNEGGGYSPTECVGNLSQTSTPGLVLSTTDAGRPLPPNYEPLRHRSAMIDTDARITLPRITRLDHASMALVPRHAQITGSIEILSTGLARFIWDDSTHGMPCHVAALMVWHIQQSFLGVYGTPATINGILTTTSIHVTYQPDNIGLRSDTKQ